MSISNYESWIERIKNGAASDEDYNNMFLMPHKRLLSELIRPEDAEWLLELGESNDTLKRGCARTLMRNIAHLPEVGEHLRKAWDENDLSDDDRNALLWRVLDDPSLPRDFHKKIWDWIKRNRGSFNKALLDYLKPYMERKNKDLIQVMEESMDDACHPESKRWIYVAAAVVSADSTESKERALNLIDRGLTQLRGTFLEEIVNELLEISPFQRVTQ